MIRIHVVETLNVASGISSPVSVISLRFNFTATCNLTSLQVVRWLSPGTEAACCVIPVVIIFSAQMLFYNIKHHNGSICTTFTDVFKLHFSCMLANIQCFFFSDSINIPKKTWYMISDFGFFWSLFQWIMPVPSRKSFLCVFTTVPLGKYQQQVKKQHVIFILM